MPRFTLKMNVFPIYVLGKSINVCWNLRTGLDFLRQLIWGVTWLGLPWSQPLSIYLLINPINVCWNPQNRACFFGDDWFESTYAQVYSKYECFPFYLFGNPINVCWNPQNRACFFETINFMGDMSRFTLKVNIFSIYVLPSPYMCDETLRTGLVFPGWLICRVTCLGLL